MEEQYSSFSRSSPYNRLKKRPVQERFNQTLQQKSWNLQKWKKKLKAKLDLTKELSDVQKELKVKPKRPPSAFFRTQSREVWNKIQFRRDEVPESSNYKVCYDAVEKPSRTVIIREDIDSKISSLKTTVGEKSESKTFLRTLDLKKSISKDNTELTMQRNLSGGLRFDLQIARQAMTDRLQNHQDEKLSTMTTAFPNINVRTPIFTKQLARGRFFTPTPTTAAFYDAQISSPRQQKTGTPDFSKQLPRGQRYPKYQHDVPLTKVDRSAVTPKPKCTVFENQFSRLPADEEHNVPQYMYKLQSRIGITTETDKSLEMSGVVERKLVSPYSKFFKTGQTWQDRHSPRRCSPSSRNKSNLSTKCKL